jgi:hypothetical protein
MYMEMRPVRIAPNAVHGRCHKNQLVQTASESDSLGWLRYRNWLAVKPLPMLADGGLYFST